MKKVLLTKSTITTCSKSATTIPTSSSKNCNRNSEQAAAESTSIEVSNFTYQQRKSMESAYKDLFKALFRIPDKLLLHRVLNAINGLDMPESTQSVVAAHIKCPQCSVKRHHLADVATQTSECNAEAKVRETANNISSEDKHKQFIRHDQNSYTAIGENSDDTPSPTHVNEEVEFSAGAAPKRKRRRRKVCLPQVVKRSQAQEAQEKLQPKLKKRKLDESNTGNESPNWTQTYMRERSDSLGSLVSQYSVESIPDISPEERVKRVFTEEYKNSDFMEAGLLPIHKAILSNDLKWLKRQIFVWKEMKKTDLNELLTDNDEDCLQLAILNNCYPAIIDVLLKSSLNPNCLDKHSNTIIHLAPLNEDVDVDSFGRIMRYIDLSMLLKLNDDGYTPLHVAVRQNNFLLAECMLNILDERLLGGALYKRDSSNKQADFMKFYENACKHLENRFAVAKVKRKLLESGEMRSGNTALFYAIENKLEHFIYFLLAHLADPRVQNHGGQDAKSFFAEFGKILNLSLKIDKTMDRVINLIK